MQDSIKGIKLMPDESIAAATAGVPRNFLPKQI